MEENSESRMRSQPTRKAEGVAVAAAAGTAVIGGHWGHSTRAGGRTSGSKRGTEQRNTAWKRGRRKSNLGTDEEMVAMPPCHLATSHADPFICQQIKMLLRPFPKHSTHKHKAHGESTSHRLQDPGATTGVSMRTRTGDEEEMAPLEGQHRAGDAAQQEAALVFWR